MVVEARRGAVDRGDRGGEVGLSLLAGARNLGLEIACVGCRRALVGGVEVLGGAHEGVERRVGGARRLGEAQLHVLVVGLARHLAQHVDHVGGGGGEALGGGEHALQLHLRRGVDAAGAGEHIERHGIEAALVGDDVRGLEHLAHELGRLLAVLADALRLRERVVLDGLDVGGHELRRLGQRVDVGLERVGARHRVVGRRLEAALNVALGVVHLLLERRRVAQQTQQLGHHLAHLDDALEHLLLLVVLDAGVDHVLQHLLRRADGNVARQQHDVVLRALVGADGRRRVGRVDDARHGEHAVLGRVVRQVADGRQRLQEALQRHRQRVRVLLEARPNLDALRVAKNRLDRLLDLLLGQLQSCLLHALDIEHLLGQCYFGARHQVTQYTKPILTI